MDVNKTVRINKTENNLKIIWEQLDIASGSLNNAFDNLSSMTELSNEIEKQKELIDISRIDSLRNEIELFLEEKDVELFE